VAVSDNAALTIPRELNLKVHLLGVEEKSILGKSAAKRNTHQANRHIIFRCINIFQLEALILQNVDKKKKRKRKKKVKKSKK
jgi:hypothetical protein